MFVQKAPPIELDTRDPHALATSAAGLVATTFFRGLNRAPRRDRASKTHVELYEQPVTPEQYEAARTALRDRMRKQELARQTRAARRNPVLAALLDDAFTRLGLLDPERSAGRRVFRRSEALGRLWPNAEARRREHDDDREHDDRERGDEPRH